MPSQFCCLGDLGELDQSVVFIQSRVELHTLGDPILFYNSLTEYRKLSLGIDTLRFLYFADF